MTNLVSQDALRDYGEVNVARKLGVIGALAVFFGVFCPYLEIGGFMSLDFWYQSIMASLIFIALACYGGLGALFISARMMRRAGIASLVLVGILFGHREYELSTSHFTSLADLHLGFGWYVLIAGSLLMLVASIMRIWQIRRDRQANKAQSPLDAYKEAYLRR